MKPAIIPFVVLLFLASSEPAGFAQGAGTSALTWEDCLAEAKKNNPELISSAEGINEEKATKDITASALYPQITADMAASTQKTNATTDTFSYGVSASQLIFDASKTFSDVRAAKENVRAASENYRFVSSSVRLSLRVAFINLLRAQELIKVTEEIVKIRRDSLVLISLRYQSGLEHKGALLTAEANVAQAQFELAQAKRSVDFTQRQLTKEMGRKDFVPLSVNGDFQVRDTARDKPDLEALAKDNPSVLEALATKNAASFGVRSAAADFAPELSATAVAQKKSGHWPPKDDQWNAGLALSMPVFEGGLQFAELSRSRSVLKQAEADERTVRDTALVALEDTWSSLQDTLETVGVQKMNLKASEEREKIAEAQYSTGFINFDDWIIIEDSLVNAKKIYLQARANALLAEAAWIQAKGETLEYAQ